MIQEDWDREAASYPQRCTSESWLDDNSPTTTEPVQADLQKCFEKGSNGFQIGGSRNSFRTATMPNLESSIHMRAKNLDSGQQSEGGGPNRIFFIQQDQV